MEKHGELGLDDSYGEASNENKLSYFCSCLVWSLSIPKNAFIKVPKWCDRNLRSKSRCSYTISFSNTDRQISLIHHTNIISTIAHSSNLLSVRVDFKETDKFCFLGRSCPTETNTRRLKSCFEELKHQFLTVKDDVHGLSIDNQNAILRVLMELRNSEEDVSFVDQVGYEIEFMRRWFYAWTQSDACTIFNPISTCHPNFDAGIFKMVDGLINSLLQLFFDSRNA